MEADLIRPALAIAFVFTLLLGVVWRFGRFPPRAGWLSARQRQLISPEQLRLTPTHSLHLVDFSGRRWLLACHPAGVTVVSEVPGSSCQEGVTGPSPVKRKGVAA